MRIVVAGASGYLGRPLVKALRAHGHQITRLVRRPPGSSDETRWDPDRGELDPSVVDGTDAVINLCGVGVEDKRWTPTYKQLLVSSRVRPTTTLAGALARSDNGPKVLLNASAVGFYGDRGDEELTEESPAGTGFFPELVGRWEAATAPAEAAGVRVAHLRTGLVLGPGGGLLGPMVPLFRLGLGGRLASGRQWMPWISLADEVGAIEYLLEAPVSGPVNLAGPAPVRNTEFARTLGAILRRPVLVPAPRFGLRLVLGGFANEALASLRVRDAVLRTAGYRYTHGDLESALRWATTQ
jgi:uncharacterized protein (TIGR01777 family)